VLKFCLSFVYAKRKQKACFATGFLFETGISIKLGEYFRPCISGDCEHTPSLVSGFPAPVAVECEIDACAQSSIEGAGFLQSLHQFFPLPSKS
jgi:hypothetical protein